MKTKTQHLAVILSVFVLMTGAVVAQNSSDNETEVNSTPEDQESVQSKLGDGVRSYNFVTKGLPAQASEEAEEVGEVDAEREFEKEPDSDTNFSISESEAQNIALKELGSQEWNLTESENSSDGVYEFSFEAGESEAEVNVDGSSGEVTKLEGEIEYEPEESEKRDSAVISLTGFIEFNNGGYELEVESEEEDDTVSYTVTIKDSEGPATQAITRKEISEQVEAEAGTYNVNLNVVRDGETVMEQTRKVEVPDAGSSSEEEDSERFEQNPENMTRDELIEEVRDLRERIRELTASESDEEDSERQGPPEEVPANPGQEDEGSNESEAENESRQGPPSETPGQGSSNRPGFVNNLLRGLFG